MATHALKLPKGQPPLPPAPLRICLNLDDIPLKETVYQQTERTHNEALMNDCILLQTFMNSRFNKPHLADSLCSNFASAFVSQSEFYEDEAPVVVPGLKAHVAIPKREKPKQPMPKKKTTAGREVKATNLMMCLK